MFVQRARDNLAAVAFCALVGGQDELVFDGHSLVHRPRGRRWSRAPAQFAEELLVATIDAEGARGVAAARRRATARPCAAPRPTVPVIARLELAPGRRGPARPVGGPLAELLDPTAEVYAALVLGLRDYVREERLPPRRARPLRRHRLRARRVIAVDALGRRARLGRGDAVAVLLRRTTQARRPRARREPRHRGARAADRARRWRPTTRRSAGSSAAARPTSPRRTCRPASAATC